MDENRSNDLVISRTFDAPVETVWRYWTEPEYFKRWWGPKDFTAPVSTIDLRVGGKYLSCMRGSDGKDYWSTGIYKEIIPQKKIVVTDSFADEHGNVVPSSHYGMEGFPLELTITVEFEELDGKTRMILRHAGIGNISEKMRTDMEQGWNESFDKLAQSLSQA